MQTANEDYRTGCWIWGGRDRRANKREKYCDESKAGTYWLGGQLQMEAQYIFEYPAWNSLLYGVSADFLAVA